MHSSCASGTSGRQKEGRKGSPNRMFFWSLEVWSSNIIHILLLISLLLNSIFKCIYSFFGNSFSLSYRHTSSFDPCYCSLCYCSTVSCGPLLLLLLLLTDRVDPAGPTLAFDEIGFNHSSNMLFTGPVVSGKWSREEEHFTLELIQNFLAGRCSDCERGELNPLHFTSITVFFQALACWFIWPPSWTLLHTGSSINSYQSPHF